MQIQLQMKCVQNLKAPKYLVMNVIFLLAPSFSFRPASANEQWLSHCFQAESSIKY